MKANEGPKRLTPALIAEYNLVSIAKEHGENARDFISAVNAVNYGDDENPVRGSFGDSLPDSWNVFADRYEFAKSRFSHPVPVLDDNGDPVKNPVLDDNGDPVLDDNGDPVLETEMTSEQITGAELVESLGIDLADAAKDWRANKLQKLVVEFDADDRREFPCTATMSDLTGKSFPRIKVAKSSSGRGRRKTDYSALNLI